MTGDARWKPNCLICHLHARVKPTVSWQGDTRYRSPLNLALSPDGKRLYVTASGHDALLVVDTTQRKVVAEIPVGQHPHGVCVSRDGKTLFVSNRWSSTVSVIDAEKMRVLRTIKVGDGPAGLDLSADGVSLFVANSLSDDVSVVDVQRGEESKRLRAGRRPFDVARSPDGKFIYVTNLLSNPVPFRTPPVTELTVIDAERQTVAERKNFRNAHLMEGVAFSPTAPIALTTLVRPKNLIPAVQVARGWMVTNGLGVIALTPDPPPTLRERGDVAISNAPLPQRGRGGGGEGDDTAQVLLDEVETFYADPCDVAFTPNGRKAYVTHSGADVISVVDVSRLIALLDGQAGRDAPPLPLLANHLGMSRKFVLTRLKTAACPKGLVASPDGRFVYVAARLADKIQVVSTERDVIVADIDLGGPRYETTLRRGDRLFHSASHTFQGQFSCRSCHPDGHVDGLTYDLESNGVGVNLVDNRNLQLIEGTSPFKWNGVSPSLYRQCGVRFAAFITRSEPFEPGDLNALVAFIQSIPPYPNGYRHPDGSLTEAQKRGKAIFERTVDNKGKPIPKINQCLTCHPPPHFTDRQKHDVDTAAKTDTFREFDTPHLLNIYQTAPYLHDGRAATLEEIWTRFGATDKHGRVNDLTKEQLNDLVEYLKTL